MLFSIANVKDNILKVIWFKRCAFMTFGDMLKRKRANPTIVFLVLYNL